MAKDDATMLAEHKHWLATFEQMGLGEPVMFRNASGTSGQALMIWLPPGMSGNPEAYRMVAKALVQAANEADTRMVNALPAQVQVPIQQPQLSLNDEDDPGDDRTLTTQGPPLINTAAAGQLTRGNIAGNQPLARTRGGAMVAADP